MRYDNLSKEELLLKIDKLEQDLLSTKKLNENLMESEEQKHFQSNLLNAVEQAVIVTNLDGEIIFWNPFAEKIYGWPSKEVIGRNIMDITVPQVSQTQATEIMSNLKAGKSWSGEFQVQHRNGNNFPIFISDTPIISAQGELTGIIGISNDISERKSTEKEIIESGQRFRSMFENHNAIMLLIEPNSGKIINSNNSATNFYGYSKDEFASMKIDDINISSPEEIKKNRKLAEAQSDNFFNFKHRLKNNTVCDVQVHSTPIEYMNQKILFSIIYDVTEQKLAEKALKLSESKFKNLVNTASDAIYLISEDGIIKEANQGASEMTGKSLNEIIGHQIDTIDPNHTIEKVIQFWKNIPLNKQIIFETTHLHKNGKLFPVEVSAKKNKQDNKIFYYSIARDITVRKLAENQITQNISNLNALIENTNDFIWSIDRDYKLLTANSEFLEDIEPLYNERLSIGSLLLDKEKLPPELYNEWKQNYDRALSGKKFMTELETKIRPEKKKFLELNYNPILNDKNEVTGVSIFGRDVTEQKKVEQALKESQKTLVSALESMSDAVFISDVNGNFIEFNESFATFHRIKDKNECTKVLNEWPNFIEVYNLDGSVLPIDKWVVNRAINGEKGSNEEYLIKRKDTGEKWYGSYNFSPIQDEHGKIIGSVTSARDITELKESNEALKESEKRFQSLSEAAFEAIFFSEKGVCIDQNTSAEKMFGYSLEEAVGRMGTEWIAPEDRKKVMNNMISGYEGPYEATGLRKDGSRFPAEIKAKNSLYKGKMLRVTALADITARKQAEEALKESEKKFRFLAENAKDVIYRMNIQNSSYEYVSPASTEIFGYTPEEFYNTPLLIAKIIHPDWVEYFKTEWHKLTEGKVSPFYEYQIIDKSGKIKWLNQRNTLIKDENGNPTAIEGAVTDITNSKEVEAELIISEERFKQVTDCSGVWIWEVDTKGLYTYVSNMQESILGYKTNDIIGKKHFYDFFAPDVKQELTKAALEVFSKKGSFSNFVNRNIHKDGHEVILETTGIPLLDKEGNLIGYRGADRDITDSVQTRNKLIESEKMLMKINKKHSAMFENIGDVIAIVDKDGMNKYQSPNVEKWFGWKPEELHGNSWDKIHPEDVEMIQQEFANLLKSEKTTKVEYRFKCKDGSYKPIELTATNLTNDPIIDGILINYHDITERKQIEDELLKAKEIAEKNESKYKDLFVKMMNAFALHEMIFNEKGEPIDYRFLEVNPAWEKIVGIDSKMVINKTIREIMPDIEDSWIQTYGRIVKTGISEEFEDYNKATKKYFHIYAYRTEPGKFAVLFNDITNKKNAERTLVKAKETAEENAINLKMAQEIAKIGNWEFNPEIGIPLWSDHVYKIYERKPKDGLPHIDDYKKIYEPDQFEIFNKYFRAAIEKGEDYDIILKLKLPDQRIKWIRAICQPDQKRKTNSGYYLRGTIQDITNLKLAEIELQKAKEVAEESEANITAIIEGTNNSIWAFDRNYQILYINHTFQQEFLQSFGVLLNPGMSLVKALPESIQTHWKSRYDRVLANEQFSLEDAVPVNNTTIYIQVSFNPIVKNGKVIGGSCLGSDITIRRLEEIELNNAKEKAEESEEKYRLLHENAGLGIGYISPEGIVLSFNTIAANDMNGVPEDFVGKSIFELFPKDAAASYSERLHKSFNSNKIEVYEDFVQLPNQNKWYLSTYTKIVDSQNNVLGIQIISQNITDIKESENELKSAKEKAEISEAKFRELFTSVGDAIFIYNPDNYEITEANEATSHIYGYSHDELIGMSCLKLSAEVDESASVAKSIKKEEEIKVNLRHHKKKDGTDVFVELSTFKIVVNGENIFYSVCHDITDRKKAELELVRLNEELEEIVNRRTKELETANEELENFNKHFIGREFRIKELRDQVKDLKNKLEQNRR